MIVPADGNGQRGRILRGIIGQRRFHHGRRIGQQLRSVGGIKAPCRVQQCRNLSPYLFTDEQGQLIHSDTFTKRLRKIYDAIGFPREYHLHTLRHYFVTSLLHCGVDKQTVADLVGHADTGFLERTYCHPQQAQKEQAADSMLTMLRPDGGQIFNLAACSPKRHSA